MQLPTYTQETWRQYGYYKRFCCGLVYIHPLRPWWWALEVYTVIGVIAFAFENHKFSPWQLMVGFTFGGMAVLSSFLATMTNPGICPKPSYQEATENYAKLLANPKLRRKEHFVRGKAVVFTYCYRCHIYRPPGAGHCAICDCCIRKWDHHCPVFGGCVGSRNTVWFLLMICSLPLFWVFLLGVSGMTSMAGKLPWYENLTLFLSVAGFIGMFCVPALFSCPCPLSRKCDSVHKRSSKEYFLPAQPLDTTGISYPRQPPSPLYNDKSKDESDLTNQNIRQDAAITFTTF